MANPQQDTSLLFYMSTFAPLIQLWAGICLLFFYQPFVRRFPFKSQIEELNKSLSRIQIYSQDISSISDCGILTIKWNHSIRVITNMAAITFFYCIFLLFLIELESCQMIDLGNPQAVSFLSLSNLLIITYVVIINTTLFITYFLTKKTKKQLCKYKSQISESSRWNKYIDTFKFLIDYAITYRKNLPNNIRSFGYYCLAFICFFFLLFLLLKFNEIYPTIKTIRVFNIVRISNTKMAIITLLTCLSGGGSILFRIFYYYFRIKHILKATKQLEEKAPKFQKACTNLEKEIKNNLGIDLYDEIRSINNGNNVTKQSIRSYFQDLYTSLIGKRYLEYSRDDQKHLLEFSEQQQRQLKTIIKESFKDTWVSNYITEEQNDYINLCSVPPLEAEQINTSTDDNHILNDDSESFDNVPEFGMTEWILFI